MIERIIFFNSENSGFFYLHKLLLNFTDKKELRKSEKSVALSNLGMYYTWENIKSSYKDSKSKISARTWNDKF